MKLLLFLFCAMPCILYYCLVTGMERDKICANIQGVETMYAKTLARTIEIIDGVKREEALLNQTEDVLQHEANDYYDALEAMRVGLIVAAERDVDLIYEDPNFEKESDETSYTYKRRLKRYYDKNDQFIECCEKNKKRRILLKRKRERMQEKYWSDSTQNQAIKAVSDSLLDASFSTSEQALDITAAALENSVKEMEERNRKPLQDEQFLTNLTNALTNVSLSPVHPCKPKTLYVIKNQLVDIEKIAEEFGRSITITDIDFLKGKFITVPFSHLLALEKKDLYYVHAPTQGRTYEYSIHHDYKNFYEKNGHIHLANKWLCPYTGYYTGLLSGRNTVANKFNSFFPAYWRPEKVIYAIFESLKDKNKLVVMHTNNSCMSVQGRTTDHYSLIIETLIDYNTCRIVSSWPLRAIDAIT